MKIKNIAHSDGMLPLAYFVAWGTALAATAASIYFIEIRGNHPAWFCWFERMLMFGLLLILTVGIFLRDRRVRCYTLPFLLFGIPSALFSQLVLWNIIPVNPQVCSVSVVCTTKFFELFGFITQATLCLTAFVVIGVCMWLSGRKHSPEEK